jgi:hypothetical protein
VYFLLVRSLRRLRDAQQRPLKEEMISIERQIGLANRTKTQLVMQLQNIDLELTAAKARYSILDQAFSDMQKRLDGESISHIASISARKVSRVVEDIIASVVDFESGLTMLSTSFRSSEVEPSWDSIQISDATANVSAYVIIELKCVIKIAKRVCLIDEKISKLETELRDYKTLGMTVVMNDVGSLIEKLVANRDEDANSLSCILQDLVAILEGHAQAIGMIWFVYKLCAIVFIFCFSFCFSFKLFLSSLDNTNVSYRQKCRVQPAIPSEGIVIRNY